MIPITSAPVRAARAATTELSTPPDMATPDGTHIEIELREPTELLEHHGKRVAADGVQAWNPVFDVTPADLIDAIVTEKGVVERPNRERMKALFG